MLLVACCVLRVACCVLRQASTCMYSVRLVWYHRYCTSRPRPMYLSTQGGMLSYGTIHIVCMAVLQSCTIATHCNHRHNLIITVVYNIIIILLTTYQVSKLDNVAPNHINPNDDDKISSSTTGTSGGAVNNQCCIFYLAFQLGLPQPKFANTPSILSKHSTAIHNKGRIWWAAIEVSRHVDTAKSM